MKLPLLTITKCERAVIFAAALDAEDGGDQSWPAPRCRAEEGAGLTKTDCCPWGGGGEDMTH